MTTDTLKSYLNTLDQSTQDRPQKTAVFCFGRFNPPTKGHGLMIERAIVLAEELDGDHFIIPSRTVDKPLIKTGLPNPDVSKNPLPFEIKVGFMKTMFPLANIVEDEQLRSPWQIPEWLGEQGYTDIRMVVGSDQIEEFERLVEAAGKYFDTFEIVSAGHRNPDASDVSGMSATKARAAARIDDIGKFRVATGWTGDQAARLMEATRLSMGVRE